MGFTQAGDAASASIQGPYNDVVGNQYNIYNLISNSIDEENVGLCGRDRSLETTGDFSRCCLQLSPETI